MLVILPYVLATSPVSRVRQVNAKLHEEVRVACVLRSEARARGRHEALQFSKRAIEVLVDDDVLRFRRVRHLTARCEKTSRDDIRLVLAALLQALFERFERRRQ